VCGCDVRAAVVRQSKAGCATYSYDLLVSCTARVLADRHTAIEWVHKHVLHLAEGSKPSLKIIYK
jgi:hypothetical protein